MKRALVALIAGTVLSGLAAAYAATTTAVAANAGKPSKSETLESKAQKLAARD